jgi:hypothetical protein
MSKKKVTRIGRRTAATALWTDAEVLALVDFVLRDPGFAQRLLSKLEARREKASGFERLGILHEVEPIRKLAKALKVRFSELMK